MRNNNKRQWPFTKTNQENTSSAMPLIVPIPEPKWYHTLQIPLSKFKQASVNNDMRALIIEGEPTSQQLADAWAKISMDYADASGDAKHLQFLKAMVEITQLSVKLQVIEDMIELLGNIYYPAYAERLNKMLRTAYKFDHTDRPQYTKELKACFMRSRGLKINLDLKVIEFEALKKKREKEGEGNKKPTMEYFDSYLVTLSNHVQYHLSDNITTFEFCERVRRHKKDCAESAAKRF
jgi:hypothetical protein